MKRKPGIDEVDDFINQAKDESAKKVVEIKSKKEEKTEKSEAEEKLKTKTIYLSQAQMKAIKRMAFYEETGESEIVRAALDAFIPSKYFEDLK